MTEDTPKPVVAWEPPDPTASSGVEPGTEPGPSPVRLWTPRDVGVVSFLLGFPAGLALTAVNSHHLGRRGVAFGLLLAGAVLVLVLSVGAGIPTGVAAALNIGLTVLLYGLVKRQWDAAELAGRPTEPGGVLRGFLVSAGGWFVTFLPTIVLSVALTFLGAQVAAILKGTVQFGTGGDQCEVTGATTTFATDQSIHIVAELKRVVEPGEIIQVSITDAAGTVLDSADKPVSTAADCITGMFDRGTIEPGSYTLDYKVGLELLAHGQFTVRAPAATAN